jgi:peptide/nickel transport system ATP-binding protein
MAEVQMPPSNDILLSVRDLHTHFFTPEGVVRAVDGVSFDMMRGKTLCVVGESGCGKSITARSILRIVEPPGRIIGGDIHFHPTPGTTIDIGRLDARSAEMRAIRGSDIAMIFQEPMSALSPLYTVGSQIGEVLRWHGVTDRHERRERSIAALQRVGMPRPDKIIDAYTFELSGGMRQRAMIAMALVGGPKLLIADEPTTALDVTTQAVILDLLRDIQRDTGMSMLFITHDLGVVAEIADEVAVMYLGMVVERGPVESVFAAPKHPYTRALLRSIPQPGDRRSTRLDAIRGMVPHPLARPGGCPFHTRCDFAISGLCDAAVPPTYPMPDGGEVNCFLYDQPGDTMSPALPALRATNGAHAIPPQADTTPPFTRQPMLTVDDVKMHFPLTKGFLRRVVGHVRAVDGVSLTLYEGETLGLVGESGSGKTTLGQTIMRRYRPTAGRISYVAARRPDPVDLATLTSRQLRPYRREIRMVFQDPYASLNPRLTVQQIIGESLVVNGIARGQALEGRVRELLGKVGLRPEYLHRYPHAFSGGERQRISIARALAPGPRLLVADEPVSALDVSVRAQILNLMADLQAELGLTYLFISHDLSVVAHISDRVAVMYAGRIVELAETDALFSAPQHPYTEALLSAVLRPDPAARASQAQIRLTGEVADVSNPPPGCAFHPRCRYVQDRCRHETPALRPSRTGGDVACHFADTLTLHGIASDSQPTVQPQEKAAHVDPV